MPEFDCKSTKMVSSPNIPNKRSSPKSPHPRVSHVQIPPPSPSRTNTELAPASDSSCNAYDHFFRLPELRRLWNSRSFPTWENESLIKPGLQALEITFRFISIILSDPRPYSIRREWIRRLESLARDQVEIIASICEDEDRKSETRGLAPIVDLSSSSGVLARNASSFAEVWKQSGAGDGEDSHHPHHHHHHTVVSRTSEASLLPRLATWHKSEDIAQKIMYSIECAFRRNPYTLGLGEPNLEGKPTLDYDAVCRPAELHALKKPPTSDLVDNHESQTLYTIHQILESWICVAKRALERIVAEINRNEFEKASDDCWMLERIWKLLEEIESLHLLTDPDDFLRLKAQLKIKAGCHSETFCFRSRGLVEIAKLCMDLRHKVPEILAVEVDPMGGPVIQEAAMKLYKEEKRESFEKIHLLQSFQAVEKALKSFFYSYKQLLVIVMGSLETDGNRAIPASDSCDTLSQIFLEPTFYPSLDGAKTFLGSYWEHEAAVGAAGTRRGGRR